MKYYICIKFIYSRYKTFYVDRVYTENEIKSIDSFHNYFKKIEIKIIK